MSYRVGFPGWKFAAKAGLELRISVQVYWDPEAKVFIGTSEDLDGLVLEAASLDELHQEVDAAIPQLITLQLSGPAPKTRTLFDFTTSADVCAA